LEDVLDKENERRFKGFVSVGDVVLPVKWRRRWLRLV